MLFTATTASPVLNRAWTYASKEVKQLYNIDINVKNISTTYFPPSIKLENIEVKNGDNEPVIKLNSLYFQTNVQQLLSGNLEVEQLVIDNPNINILLKNGVIQGFEHLFNKKNGSQNENKTDADKKKDAKTNAQTTNINELLKKLYINIIQIKNAEINIEVDEDIRFFTNNLSIDITGNSIKSLDVKLNLVNSQLRYKEFNEHISYFNIELFIPSFNLKSFQLNKFALKSDNINLDLSASATIENQVQAKSFINFGLNLDILNKIAANIPEITGRLDLKTDLSFPFNTTFTQLAEVLNHNNPLDLILAKTDVSLKNFKILEYSVNNMTSSLTYSKGSLDINNMHLEAPGILADIKGKFKVSDLTFVADVDAKKFHLEGFLNGIGISKIPVDLEVSGNVKGKGDIKKLYFYADTKLKIPDLSIVTGSGNKVMNIKKINGKISLSYNDFKLDIKKGSTVKVFDSLLEVEGIVPITLSGEYNLKAASSNINLKDLGSIVGMNYKGYGYLRSKLTGKLAAPVIDSNLDISNIAIMGYPLSKVRGMVTVDVNNMKLNVPSLNASISKDYIQIAGGLDLKKLLIESASISLENINIQKTLKNFLPDLKLTDNIKGKAEGYITLWGNVIKPNGKVELLCNEVLLWDQPINKINLVSDVNNLKFNLRKMFIQSGEGKIKVSGTINPFNLIDIKISSENLSFSDIKMLNKTELNLNGNININSIIQGKITNPNITTSLKLDMLTFKGRAFNSIQLNAKLIDKIVTINGKFADSTAKLTADLELKNDFPFSSKIVLNSSDFTNLVPLSLIPNGLSGNVKGFINAKGSIKNIKYTKAELKLSKLVIIKDNMRFENPETIHLTYLNADLYINSLKLKSKYSSLYLKGLRNKDGVLDFKFEGELDLSIADLLIENIEEINGKVDIAANLKGTDTEPIILGTMNVNANSFKYHGFPHEISDIDGQLVFTKNQISLEHLEARIADGLFNAGGYMQLTNYKPSSLDLKINFTDTNLRVPKNVPMTVSGEVLVSGNPGEKIVVGGELNISKLRYKEQVNLVQNMIDAFRDKRVHPKVFSKSKELIDFDLRIAANDNVKVANNLMDLELKLDLKLTGTNQKIGLLGDAYILDSEVTFGERQYTITRGNINFDYINQIHPNFDIEAVTEIGAQKDDQDVTYYITVNASGNLDKVPDSIKIAYSADDSDLTKEDIVALLTIGMTTQDLVAASGSNAAVGSSLELLTKISGIDEHLKRLVPLPNTEMRLTYELTDNNAESSTISPHMEFNWQATKKLRLKYKRALDGSLNQGIRLDYSLTKRTALSGGWDSNEDSGDVEQDLGVDLRWKWNF